MVTEADHSAWGEPDFEPYLDVAFEAFGYHRLMFGSDWPVCLLAGNYRTVIELVENYVKRHLRLREQEAFWGQNCQRFYLSRPVS
jgi:L-fuconolactonase